MSSAMRSTHTASYAKSCIIILLVTTLVAACFAPAASTDGVWGPIPGVDDRGIVFIAKWALQEHTRLSGETLTLDQVLTGSQLSQGPVFTFRLLINTMDANRRSAVYKIEVLDGPWTNTRVLNSFVPASWSS